MTLIRVPVTAQLNGLADVPGLIAALSAKGTYSKPSGGIPLSDLATAVATQSDYATLQSTLAGKQDASTAATDAEVEAVRQVLADAIGQKLTQSQGDTRYVRTVNGTAPDGAGNVAVSGGGTGPTVTLTPTSGTRVDDLARINAALQTAKTAKGRVVLIGDFFISGPIVVPSNVALEWEGTIELLSDSNSAMIANENQTIPGSGVRDHDITISGRGPARSRLIGLRGALLAAAAPAGSTSLSLDRHPGVLGTFYLGANQDEKVTVTAVSGTAAPYTATLSAATANAAGSGQRFMNQKRTATTRYLNIAVQPVNVDRVRISGFGLGPTQFVGIAAQVCNDATVDDIEHMQDGVSDSQDGVDIWGCQRVLVSRQRGATGDDFSYVAAHYYTPAMHPAVRSAGGMNNVAFVHYQDCAVVAGINFIRLIAGYGKTISSITGNSLRKLPGGQGNAGFLKLGDLSYVTQANRGTASDINGVFLSDVEPGGLKLISADLDASNIHIDGVLYDANASKVDTLLGFLSTSNTAVTLNDVTITRVRHGNAALSSSNVFQLVNLAPGSTVTGLRVQDVWYVKGRGVLTTTGYTLTDAHFEDIHFGTLVAALFSHTPAASGSVSRIKVGTYTGVTQRYAIAMACKLTDVPQFTGTDVAPAPVLGSRVLAAGGFNPGTGSVATQAEYLGDGTAWNRTITLAN